MGLSKSCRHARALRCCALLGVVVLLAEVAGCSRQPPFALQDISGLLPRLQLRLTDGDNRPVTAQSYRGDVVLMYFGYTHCPDVCPTTLAMLSQALRGLGPAASRVRVLFVSVDPQRDSAALLKQYAGSFGPQFIGLRGDNSELLALTRRYRVAFHLDQPDQYGNYAVEHSSAVFVFDQDGRPRVLAGSATEYQPAAITQDLRRLIASG